MLTMFVSVLVLLATFLAADRLTCLMILLAPRLGLMDQPDARRVHHTATPRNGGIAVFLAMLLGIAMIDLADLPVAFGDGWVAGNWVKHFLLGAGLLVAVGAIDDRWDISAWWKLSAQIAAAVVMFLHDFSGAGRVFGIEVPWWVDLGIYTFWVVALVNAFNLIDGMDGLCSGLGLISLGILSTLALAAGRAGDALLIGVMMVALLAFLRHNFHPAKIFLGDAGSMLIGFFVATAGQATVGRNAVVAGLLLPLLVAGVPLFDVLLAVWRRAVRRFLISQPGEAAVKIFGADREHLHHRVLSWGIGQRRAAVLLYALASVLAVLALIPMLGGDNLVAFSVVGIIVVVLVGLRYIAPLEIIESAEGLRALIRRPICRAAVVSGYFVYDTCVIAGSIWFAIWLVEGVSHATLPPQQAWMIGSLYAGCCLLGLRFARAHQRRWTRAGTQDFIDLVAWLVCGITLSAGLVTVLLRDLELRNVAIHLVAFGLSAAALFIPRCIGSGIQAGAFDAVHRRRRNSTSTGRPTLLYGAGDLGELFLRNLRLSPPNAWSAFAFVGLIDDQKQLKNRRLLGLPILGSLDELESIVVCHGVESIILTMSALAPESHAELLRKARSLKLEIRHWLPDLEPKVSREEPSLPPLGPSFDRRVLAASRRGRVPAAQVVPEIRA